MVLQSLERAARVPDLFRRRCGAGRRLPLRLHLDHGARRVRAARRQQPGAAISLGLSMIGFALPLTSSIGHSDGVLDMAIWGVIALIVQIAVYYVARIPVPDLSQRIANGRDRARDLARRCVGHGRHAQRGFDEHVSDETLGPGRSRTDGRDRHDGGRRLHDAAAPGMPAAPAASTDAQPAGGAAASAPSRQGENHAGAALGQLALEFGLSRPSEPFAPDVRATARRPRSRPRYPERPQRYRLDQHIELAQRARRLARRLRLDRPCHVGRHSGSEAGMLNAGLAPRRDFRPPSNRIFRCFWSNRRCAACGVRRMEDSMKRSGQVGLVLMGAAAFVGDVRRRHGRTSPGRSRATPRRRRPSPARTARRAPTARRIASRSGAALPTTSIRAVRLVVGLGQLLRAANEPEAALSNNLAHLSRRRPHGAGQRRCARRFWLDRDSGPFASPPAAKLAACSASPATSAPDWQERPMRPASASTPLRASATGTSAPTTRSR